MDPGGGGHGAPQAAELSAFIDCLRRNAAFDLGSELGWKTLFVANLAESSARSHGRRFDLVQADGSAIATVDDAAAYAGAVSSLAFRPARLDPQ